MFNQISTKKENKRISISDFIRDYLGPKFLDFDPPYQRGDVWDKKYKRNLVESIFEGIPIGSFHLVAKGKNALSSYVLDGKQRLKSLQDFIDNKFPVEVSIDGREKISVKYKDIINSKEEHFIILRRRFIQFELSCTLWEEMSIPEQRDIFVKINYSRELNLNERIYCKNFLSANLFTNIFTNYMLPEIKNHLQERYETNNRFNGTKLCHQICFLSFGEELNKYFSAKDIAHRNLRENADHLQNKLINLGFREAEDEINESWFQKLDIFDNIKILKRACHLVGSLLSFDTTISKKEIGCVVIQDFITFFIKLHQNKKLTFSQIESNKKNIFQKVIVEYCKNRPQLKTTSQKDKIESRLNVLNSLLEKTKLDLETKNNHISSSDKISAKFSASTCGVCRCLLHDNNYNVHHTRANSLHSKSEFKLLCVECNNRISNVDKNFAEVCIKENIIT